MQIIPQSEDEIKMRVILISVLLKISLKISAEIFYRANGCIIS